MTAKKVVLAPQNRIEAYDDIAREFFRAVLDMQYGDCLVTDESRLSDFASCGLPEEIADAAGDLKDLYARWDRWVVPVIGRRYGLVDVSPAVLLFELFERIEGRRSGRVH